MAVESRFVVIRHGVEAKTFMDKKSADEYDKMLDMADNLAEVFAQAPIDIADTISEELSIYLAQHRDEVLVALLAKKAVKKPAEKVEAVISENELDDANKEPAVKAKPKAKKSKKAVKLSEVS